MRKFSLSTGHDGTEVCIYLNRVGVHLEVGEMKLTLPWIVLSSSQAVQRVDRGLHFSLRDSRPGQGYIVTKGKVDGDFVEIGQLIALDTQGLTLWVDADDVVIQSIQAGRERFFSEVERFLSLGAVDGGPVALRSVDSDQRCCVVDRSVPLRWPSFCPNSGDLGSQVGWLDIEGTDEQIPWFVSHRWNRKSRWAPCVQLLAAGLATVLYWLIGYLWIVSPDATASLSGVLASGLPALGVFLVIPLVGWWSLPQIRAKQGSSANELIVRMNDPEYFASFVALNS